MMKLAGKTADAGPSLRCARGQALRSRTTGEGRSALRSRTTGLALALVAATGCYRNPPPDPASAVCTGKWSVFVTNHSPSPIDVLLVVAPSTTTTTLGSVKMNSRSEFNLPKGSAKVSYQASDAALRDGDTPPQKVDLRYSCSL